VRRIWGRIAVGALVLVVASCSHPTPSPRESLRDDAITVASFNFPESRLLAELYAQALEAAGFRVIRAPNLGTRELVEPALERGLVELVPEYSGSLLEFIAGTGAAHGDELATNEDLRRALAGRGLVALDPAPAQDRNGLVVTPRTAAMYGLRAISDLAPVAEELTFGGPAECAQRPLCLPGLRSTYGIRFGAALALDESGPVTIAALLNDQIQVGLVFSSSAAIAMHDLVLLDDDRHLQPAENVTPVVNAAMLERFGDPAAAALDAVSARLTTVDLRAMNAAMTSGQRAADVAADWLGEHGLTGPLG
jgi:osmoprotectant transport system substrate-binding protein